MVVRARRSRVLAGAFQAVAAKLTEAQAQQALAPLLQQISDLTNPFALQVLAEGLKALPTNLTEAQTQWVFAFLLQRIGNSTKFIAANYEQPTKLRS